MKAVLRSLAKVIVNGIMDAVHSILIMLFYLQIVACVAMIGKHTKQLPMNAS